MLRFHKRLKKNGTLENVLRLHMISYKQMVAEQSEGYGRNLGRGKTGTKAKT